MKIQHYLFSLLMFAMICFAPNVFAVVCDQTCIIATTGGPIMPDSTEISQKTARSTYETVKSGYQATREFLAETQQTITNFENDVKSMTVKAIQWPGKQMQLGTDWALEQAGVSQTDAKKDQSVQDSIKSNINKSKSETDPSYDKEYYVLQQRQYIRQQANINLLANVLYLKSFFPTIREIMEEADGKVEEAVQKSKAQKDGSMETTQSETQIMRDNLELRMAILMLLSIQKSVDAAVLQYNAEQALSSMKLVKKVPQIQ